MCDYSLAGLPSRLAVEGEQLVVHRFPTGTLGLASPCASPSRDIPKDLQQQFSIRGTEEVAFVQLSATPYQFRDAVRFSNGREILLQQLQCGQQVEVLSLSSGDFEHEGHRRLEEEYQRLG